MSLPATTRQVTVTKLGTNFRDVTEIRDVPLVKPGSGEVLVKVKYVGINASDINLTSGRYDPNMKPPFPAGLEGTGEIVAIGEGVSLKVGQAVAFIKYGCFSEYVIVPAASAVPVPAVNPALMSIVLSGLTASISLEKEGELKAGKNVLVTAAAGGTGQFAVQIAKLAGCHVIGTCSSPEKSEFLKSIGCDRVINYKNENVGEVLGKEYPKGVDVVYECVGQDMFDTALSNLAVYGRLIVIGAISGYERDNTDLSQLVSKLPVAMMTLRKSARVCGFFLPHYPEDFPRHIATLAKLHTEGKLKVNIDKGENLPNGPFKGLEKTVDGVEYMFSRMNIGKVVVEL